MFYLARGSRAARPHYCQSAMGLTTKPLRLPKTAAIAPDVAASGPSVPPIERIRLMSPDVWEDFIFEWAHSLKTTYARTEQRAGAGDQGLDIVGFASGTSDDPWDNYQCKRYAAPLAPSDIWVELGKIAYYTHINEYSMPRAYWFVSPFGAGNSLAKLLRRPKDLQAGLVGAWTKHCQKGITTTKEIPLKGGLSKHIAKMDFSIFGAASPLTIIDGHRKTPWFVVRFGGGLPMRPGPPPTPPPSIAPLENNYVRALLDAYEDRLQTTLSDVAALASAPLTDHLTRSRREFYSAESLREFSRDNVPQGTFESFLDEVHDGVADVVQAKHTDSFERVLAVVRQAKGIHLTANALVTRTTTTDRGGMCHQLANEKRVKWRP